MTELRTLVAALALATVPVWAQDAPAQVHLNGLLGSKAALLVIDGEPRTVQTGASVKGVKLIAIDEEQRAVVEFGGRRHTLTLGAAPGRLGVDTGPAPARVITLPMGPGGHFIAVGTINGQSTQFLVDTGATNVALSQVEADRLGLRYTTGKRAIAHTANGAVPAHVFNITSLRIGEVEVRNVEAMVIPAAMSHVLLGNSFLNRFQMKRENDTMTLEPRY